MYICICTCIHRFSRNNPSATLRRGAVCSIQPHHRTAVDSLPYLALDRPVHVRAHVHVNLQMPTLLRVAAASCAPIGIDLPLEHLVPQGRVCAHTHTVHTYIPYARTRTYHRHADIRTCMHTFIHTCMHTYDLKAFFTR